MFTGAHTILYSRNAEALRTFFRDVLAFPSVDAGGGWLIFATPPGELAVHPSEGAGRHELFLMCDDIHASIASLKAKGVECAPVTEERWGLLTYLSLPDGERLGLYEPRHKTAIQPER